MICGGEEDEWGDGDVAIDDAERFCCGRRHRGERRGIFKVVEWDSGGGLVLMR